MGVWAVVVAAGQATRFGRAKQFELLGGRRVVDWSVAAAGAACDGVVAVVPPEWSGSPGIGADAVVEGARTRAGSVRAGLAAVPPGTGVVVVHDAARPLATPRLYTSAVEAVQSGADGAVCAVPIDDTVKKVEDHTVVRTVDRRGLWAVQTPQAFSAGALLRAHVGEPEATDDAGLVEAAGGRVVVVPGEARNLKLTRPQDLAMAEALLASSELAERPGQPASASTSSALPGRQGELASGEEALAPGPSALSVRVGHGFDVHAFSQDPGRGLVLGGVTLPGHRGLAGHSDADVVTHAVAEALLGAAGLGDLGRHFPDDDPAWAGADSVELLSRVVDRLAAAGWRPANADCTVALELPRLAPHRRAMEERLGGAVRAPVSVKATRPEGLGSLGRGEGIACWAVALIGLR